MSIQYENGSCIIFMAKHAERQLARGEKKPRQQGRSKYRKLVKGIPAAKFWEDKHACLY